MVKLKEKGQGLDLRRQAYRAVSFFHEMNSQRKEKNNDSHLAVDQYLIHAGNSDIFQEKNKNKHTVSKDTQLKSKEILEQHQHPEPDSSLLNKNKDWSKIFLELSNSIKLRHYSPSTLKTYLAWNRKFQAFVKNKDPESVTTDDVKAFLTWLAVQQKVSASSQNQAFNALLYLFQLVLHREVGEIDGVVRAINQFID